MEQISTLTVAKAVAEKFINMIATGELKWGEKLLPQRELAKILHVGMSSLREGLLILEGNGFIEIRRGDGTYVTKDPSRVLSNSIEISIQIDTSLQDLIEAGDVIQTEIAGLAAKKSSKVDINKLKSCLIDIEKSNTEDDSLTRHYIKFHQILTKSVKNPLLYKLNMAIIASLKKLLGEIPHNQKRLAIYWDVLNAIESKNIERTKKAMEKLLSFKRHMYLPERKRRKKSG